jgi:alpha-1,3-rhamnosyl/mannosyltransferase
LSLGGQARQNLYRSEFLKLATRGRFDLVHEPNQINWACDLPTVMTIHDLSPIRNPQWHPADRIEAFQRGLDASRRYLVHVLTDSEAIRREVIHDLGIDGSHVTAVAIGVGDEFRPQSIMEVAKTRRRLQLPTNYLLAVGTIEPRKNILNLMRSFCALPDAVRRRCPLVLAGGWGWRFAETQAFFHDTARHRDVIHVGYVAARDLPAVYAGARALVFPSYYEGFGLPPLEMLACGGAVLASDIPVTREVLGNHAQFIAPDDGDAWRNTMQRVITDDDLVNERRRGGLEHARAYSWRRTAEKTWNVYRRIHACGTGMGRAAA